MGKRINYDELIGKKFNKLTILEICPAIPYKHRKCKAQCECGQITTPVVRDITLGHTKSCGCGTDVKKFGNKFQDEIGHKYGRLTVVSRAPNIGTSAAWNCVCDCGGSIVVTGVKLRKNIVTSCGCKSKADLRGKQFEWLTALEPLDKRSADGHIIWKTQCNQCGEILEIASNHIQRSIPPHSCKFIKSKGEEKIKKFLDSLQIKYQQEYTQQEMKFKNTKCCARYDFAIYDDNKLKFLLEYHGEQHYEKNISISGWNTKENYETTHARDLEKIEMCKQYNTPLEIIPYTEFKNLEEVVKQLLIKYNLLKEP